MTSRKEVIAEIDYLFTLTTILETYEEIAASRMQRIRNQVLLSRDFVFEINNISLQIKSSYKKEMEKLTRKSNLKDPNKISFRTKNGKTLLVFLSSNTGLYGNIIRDTFNLFSQKVKEGKSDLAILGKLGLQFFQEEFGHMPFTYFDLPDNKIDEETFRKIIDHIVQYERVIVFYQQFQSIVSQRPQEAPISGEVTTQKLAVPQVKYLFEPSLEKILGFFEKETFASAFEQTIYESQLAKFASRMISLDSAVGNTKDRLKQSIFQKDRMQHQTINKKQTETVSSLLSLMGKR